MALFNKSSGGFFKRATRTRANGLLFARIVVAVIVLLSFEIIV